MKTHLEADEIQKLENAAKYIRDMLLIRILFHSGCRISEALSLAVDDVDFTNGTVTIENLKPRLHLACPKCDAVLGKSNVFCPKCGAAVKEAVVVREQECRRARTLPLDIKTLEMLEDFIKRGGPVKREGMNFIFGISRHRAWEIVKECAERANLPKLANAETGRTHNVTPSGLRVAFATHAIRVNDSGDGLRLLQEHLGHVSFNATAKYRKAAGEQPRDWYNRLWEKEVIQNET